MAVVPNNNLPPESQPWARDRDAVISQLQYDSNKAAQDNANAFKGLNNTLTAISKQLADLSQVQSELVSQQAELAAQQTTILGLIDATIEVDSANVSATNMAFTTTLTTYITHVFNVPEGYTNATVFVSGSARATNSSGSNQYFGAQTFVWSPGTSWGYWGGFQQVTIPGGYQSSVSAPVAANAPLTGAPGQTLEVYTKASSTVAFAANADNYVGVSAVVMYTR
jgi:hypothetical protein